MSQYDHTTTTPEKLQVLCDEKFPWRDKKLKTYRLARLYDLAGYRRYGDRVAACASWLQYDVAENPDDALGEPVRMLSGARFCDLRLCPMCNARKAKRAAFLLSRILDETQRRRAGTQYIFLTLTVRNVAGPELGDAVSGLCKAWARLMDHRRVKAACTGWFRAIEITRNRADGTYHPHIHAILSVDFDYFRSSAGKYIRHDEWVERWRKALRVDYQPSVRIEATRAKGAKRKSRDRAAAEEAAKYATKDSEYIPFSVPEALAAEIVKTYTEALRRKRLTAFGGVLKYVAQLLDADNLEEGDLIHIDDEAIREDVATMVEIYRWHMGVWDYLLERVETL